jgi:hypothetical protein
MGQILAEGQVNPNQFALIVKQSPAAMMRTIASGASGKAIMGRAKAGTIFDTINSLSSTDNSGLFPIPIPGRRDDPYDVWRDRCDYVLKLYYWDGVIGTSVDTLSDLTAAGFRLGFSGPEARIDARQSSNVMEFLAWVEERALEDLIRWSIRDYTLYSRAVVLRLGEGRNRYYSMFNPAPVAVLGPLNMKFEDEMRSQTDQDSNFINVGVPEDAMQPESMQYMGTDETFRAPSWMKKKEINRKTWYVFDPNVVRFIDRKKPPYMRYPVPFLMRAAYPQRLKRILEMMDEATAEDMINCVVLVTIGNDQFPASKKQFDEIRTAFETDKRSFTVYWNHTLQVQMLRPPAGEILGPDKYDAVNRGLYAGIGIPMFLVDSVTGGGGYNNQWVQVEILLKRLDAARREIKFFWERELNEVAQAFGIKGRVYVIFEKVDLRPQDRFKALVGTLSQMGSISPQTAMEEAGYDPQAEIERLLEAKEWQDRNGILIPMNQKQEPGRPTSGPGQPYPEDREPTGEEPT